jgi:prepilin-type N-terminal cleavage/methylation domain-containing protein
MSAMIQRYRKGETMQNDECRMQNEIRASGFHSAFCIRHSALRRRLGFTLVELLTVIIIIGILVGILIPTITHIRRTAYNTGVEAQIGALRQAIDQYYADFHAYPGPVSNQVMGTGLGPADPNYIYMASTVPAVPAPPAILVTNLTGPENLVLGLIGGLTNYQGAPNAVYVNAGINYNPLLVGTGATSLNTGLPKKFGTYIDTGDLSSAFNSTTKNGMYSDSVVPGGIADSPVPEILDRFPNKMPILYIRASVGATMYNAGAAPANISDYVNPVVINGLDPNYASSTGGQANTAPMIRYAQYDIGQIIAYTKSYNGASIGEGKTPPTYVGWSTVPTGAVYPFHGLQTIGVSAPNPSAVLSQNDTTGTYQYPYPAYPYFKDPNSPAYSAGPPTVLPYARAKDTYILISAGVDRIYGTADDITSFGDVRP